MRLLREITVADIKVIVREMTVAEIRAWLSRKGDESIDMVDSFLSEDVALNDLPDMTDLTMEVINGLTPSEIDEVITACKEVNSRFFAMRARVADVGQRILSRQANVPAS